MHILKDICNNLEYQLEDVIKKGDISTSELDLVYKSVKTIYYIKTIEAMEDYKDDEERYSRSYGRSDYGYSNRSRNSMGRYSSEGRSYDYDYSGDTKEELQRLMNSAQNDREREAIRKALDSMNR